MERKKPKKKRCFDSQTISFLESHGIIADHTERKLGRNVTKDLFGFGDVFGFDMKGNCYIVQHTSNTHVSTRKKKILLNRTAKKFLEASDRNRILVLGWYDCSGIGMKCRVVEIKKGDFKDAEVARNAEEAQEP